MQRSLVIRSAAVFALTASFALAQTTSTLVAVSTEGLPDGGIQLRFDPGPAEFGVGLDAAGRVEVRLTGTAAASGLAAADGWTIQPADGGLVVRSEATASAIVRMSRAGATLVVIAALRDGHGATGYRLGVGDVVSVAVYEDKSLSNDYTVGQDGNLNMPLIGAVPSVGISETELADRIRARLSEFLDAPNISVTIQAFRSQSVFVNVTGDSPRASKIPLRPEMSLSDVLAEAGVALLPGQPVELRRNAGDSQRRTVRLDPDQVEAADAPRPVDGDRIVVLEPRYVYIRGEVTRAGRFLHRPGLTVQQLIALAGGLTEWASRKEIRILRETADGTRDLDVDLRRIESGRDPDLELQPGDLVLLRRRAL